MIQSVLVGAAALVMSMVSYGTANALLLELVVRLIRNGYQRPTFWNNLMFMVVFTFLTGAMHMSQIALWAVIFLACGEFSTFEEAFYVSAENYTALGYGDVILSHRWRLLGPLEAINGLLLFGLSTAVLFAVMSRLIAIRLRLDGK